MFFLLNLVCNSLLCIPHFLLILHLRIISGHTHFCISSNNQSPKSRKYYLNNNSVACAYLLPAAGYQNERLGRNVPSQLCALITETVFLIVYSVISSLHGTIPLFVMFSQTENGSLSKALKYGRLSAVGSSPCKLWCSEIVRCGSQVKKYLLHTLPPPIHHPSSFCPPSARLLGLNDRYHMLSPHRE